MSKHNIKLRKTDHGGINVPDPIAQGFLERAHAQMEGRLNEKPNIHTGMFVNEARYVIHAFMMKEDVSLEKVRAAIDTLGLDVIGL